MTTTTHSFIFVDDTQTDNSSSSIFIVKVCLSLIYDPSPHMCCLLSKCPFELFSSSRDEKRLAECEVERMWRRIRTCLSEVYDNWKETHVNRRPWCWEKIWISQTNKGNMKTLSYFWFLWCNFWHYCIIFWFNLDTERLLLVFPHLKSKENISRKRLNLNVAAGKPRNDKWFIRDNDGDTGGRGKGMWISSSGTSWWSAEFVLSQNLHFT